MVTWLESTLTTLLATYKETHTTTLTSVAVFDTNSLEKKVKDTNESEVINITYRELPSQLPNSPVKDRIISANLYIVALESEKTAVKDLFNTLIETYHAKETDGVAYYFTLLTPVGAPINNGYLEQQSWQIGVTYLKTESLTNIHDRTVTVGSYSATADTGLLFADLQRVAKVAEYPSAPTNAGKNVQYLQWRLSFTLLDVTSIAIQGFKAMIYGTTNSYTLTYTSGTLTKTITATLLDAHDSIAENGFPTLTFVFEGG